MTNNERILRKRISDLDERILVLESIFQVLFDTLNNTHANHKPICNICGITPFEGFVCSNNDCPHGLNSKESCKDVSN